MTFLWSDDFHPRSLCNWGGGDDGGDGGGGGGGDSDSAGDFGGETGGGDFVGDTGGDFVGDTASEAGPFSGADTSGPESSDVSNADFFGTDTSGPETSGPDFSGPESSNVSNADFFGSDVSGPDFSGPESSSVSNADFFGGPDFSGPESSNISNADFFGTDFGPTAGVDFTGGPSFGANYGGNTFADTAVGPSGWATGPTGGFGTYGTGGPTDTGFGPGSTNMGTTMAGQAPGVTGFPGDFNAPPGGAFGMPNTQDVGPQAGAGMPGGPSNVGTAEQNFAPATPSAPATAPSVNPEDRSEAPSSVFGPEFASNQAGPTVGNFGFVGQAHAADRGTDALATAMQSAPFAQIQAMAEQVAQTNPDLAQALMGIALNQNVQSNMVGPMMTGFEQTTPGAQHGFVGVSPAQAAASGPFTGQQSLSGVSGFTNDQVQGKGDRGATETAQQANPNFDLVGPMTTQQGYQQLAAEMNAQQAQQAPQQPNEQSPQSIISNAFESLTGKGPGLTQEQFDTRFAQPNEFTPAYDLSQPPADRGPVDPFSSRFGDFRSNEEQQQQLEQLQTNFGPNYGPQAPGIAPPGQLGPGFELSNPNVTPGQQQFGQAIMGQQFSSPQAPGERGPVDPFSSRFGDFRSNEEQQQQLEQLQTNFGPNYGPQAPSSRSQTETLGPQIGQLLSALDPATRGVGREAAPIGLWSMMETGRSSPSNPGGRGSPSSPGGRGNSFGPGAPGGPFGGRGSTGPGLSVTVGGRGAPGYYSTGGPGIAPGARGAEYGGIYGPGVATGRAGTNSFGVSSREGAYGFFDPVTGLYY